MRSPVNRPRVDLRIIHSSHERRGETHMTAHESRPARATRGRQGVATGPTTTPLVTFDRHALLAALDSRRRSQRLGWYDLAAMMWDQSAELNAQGSHHPLCGGALQRLATTRTTSCQYALFMLRWLDRPPEDFLVGPVIDVGETRLPRAGTDRRLRWDLHHVHTDLDTHRTDRHLTWAQLGAELACTPNRLTNLRTARRADLTLTMRITQHLRRPAATYIQPADW